MITIEDIISSPGEILDEEFLKPLGISQYRLAKAIGKPQSAISDIVHGKRAITPEMAYSAWGGAGNNAAVLAQSEMTYRLKLLENREMPNVVALV